MATTLKEILGAILSDAIRAQHDANTHLQMLADQYGAGGRLSGMKLPSSSLGELELSLSYAVTGGIEQREEKGVNGKEVDKTLRYVARECAELLIKTMVHTIQASNVNYKAHYSFIDTLQDNRDFSRHLTRRFLSLLTADRDTLVGTDAKLIEEGVRNVLYTAAEEHLLDHEDIRNLFLQDDARGLRANIATEMDRVLKKELDDILRESTMPSFRRIQRYGSLQVEIASEALAQLPPDAIKTMTIRVIPSQGDIVVQKNEE